jgi:hypothetical protein
MKKSFLLFLLIGITLLSCTQSSDDSIVSTNNSGSSLYLTSEQFLASSNINGASGDELTLTQSFVNTAGRNISISAHLHILPNAYSGIKEIFMIVDAGDASVRFYPETIFNRDVRLDLVFTGLDLQNMGFTTSGNANFVYFNNNGTTEAIANDGSTVNISQSVLSVQNAKLYHFSRYGWVR